MCGFFCLPIPKQAECKRSSDEGILDPKGGGGGVSRYQRTRYLSPLPSQLTHLLPKLSDHHDSSEVQWSFVIFPSSAKPLQDSEPHAEQRHGLTAIERAAEHFHCRVEDVSVGQA